MSNFLQAIPQVLINEGGYSNVTGDNGGETYRGITRKNFPNWEGWKVVDQNKPLHDEQIIHNSDLEKEVSNFYEGNFWEPNRLGEIKDQGVAGKVLDMAVNMGSSRAGKILQQVLANDCRIALDIDGKIGGQTLQAVNSQQGKFVLNNLRKRCVDFYEGIAENDANNRQFLNGWLKRANQ